MMSERISCQLLRCEIGSNTFDIGIYYLGQIRCARVIGTSTKCKLSSDGEMRAGSVRAHGIVFVDRKVGTGPVREGRNMFCRTCPPYVAAKDISQGSR